MIRLSKIDNPTSQVKWNKYEVDGSTPHTCKKPGHNRKTTETERQQQQQTPHEREEVEEENGELRAEVSGLRGEVRQLIAQVQLLRMDLSKALRSLP